MNCLTKLKNAIKYINSDYFRYYGKNDSFFKITLKALFSTNHCFRYLFWLRLSANLRGGVARFIHYRLSIKYNIQIPIRTKIGYGLYIGHGVGIVINGDTVIGNNVNLSQFLSIGTNHKTPAIIGDNVYIGPNVCIVENVIIGNNVTIGAGAVVTKDIPSNTTVAGVPAKIIGQSHLEYIQNQVNLHTH